MPHETRPEREGEKGSTLGADDAHGWLLRGPRSRRHRGDSEAAEASLFGGLIASGWHTGAICMRLLVDNQLDDSRAMGAIGVDDLRWPTAVRPGDTLRVETEVRDKEPWRPGIGLVHSGATVFNQGDETVMTMTGLVLFERRDREAND
ncbi:dehydratase [Halobacteriales archaeon QS_8_65_32]|nr:MAG: dehydratase [Halobacteriales archaeon QS_8_65_32]